MATSKKSGVLYRDPTEPFGDDGQPVNHRVSVVDGDVGDVITVKLDNDVEVQVAPLGEQQIGAAWYVADESELPA